MSAAPPVERLFVHDGGIELAWLAAESLGRVRGSRLLVAWRADGLVSIDIAVGKIGWSRACGHTVLCDSRSSTDDYGQLLLDPRDMKSAWNDESHVIAERGMRMFARLCALLSVPAPDVDLRGVPLALVVTLQRFVTPTDLPQDSP